VSQPPPTDRAGFVENRLTVTRALNNSSTHPIDEGRVQQVAGQVFDRGPSRDGPKRQMDAVRDSGSRLEALRKLAARALVVHGDCDPMIPLSAGRQTAAAIPNAQFVSVAGMGHYLPPGVWSTLVETFATFVGETK
jgi:pimeloyl-ACP methyl ester carboxylesterase